MQPFLLILLLSAVAPPAPGSANLAPPGRPANLAPPVAAAAVAPPVHALRAHLAALLRTGWRGAEWSVLVVSLDRGDTLFAYDADRALAPASNVKLFTAAAALYYLGPEFRYTTFLLTNGRIDEGVLAGDVIVYGTGDPTLSDRFYESKVSVWEIFADSLLALGVREIRGEVVGDASYFGGRSTGLGWEQRYRNAWYAAPASALSLNENVVTLRIRPAAQAGWRPEILLVPGGDGIALVNQATTVPRGRAWINVDRAAYDGPIVVRGRIARSHPGLWRAVPVADPARFAAAVLREVLERKGIRVAGGVRSVVQPEQSPVTGRLVFAPAFDDRRPLSVLAVHRSPPLLDILTVVNQKSHNFYAEQVLRTIGRVALDRGTADGGAHAIRHMLERETSLDSLALVLLDGSGLSPLNRASARTIIHLLGYMAASPMADAFWTTLPEAGDPHGLRRMYRTAAERNLRAKTGTIERVSALSGYVRTAEGERLAFSILSNKVPSTWKAKRVEDAIGARLAAFRRDGPALSRDLIARADPPRPAEQKPARHGAAVAARRQHVIRRGDTLEGIAQRYGVTLKALRTANPGLNPRRLVPGKIVRVP